MEVQLNDYFIPAVVGVDDTLFPLALSLSFKVVDFDSLLLFFLVVIEQKVYVT